MISFNTDNKDPVKKKKKGEAKDAEETIAYGIRPLSKQAEKDVI